MFLTHEELRELTGYKVQTKQRRWLEQNGVPHTVNAGGKPVVLVAVVEKMHGVLRNKQTLIDWEGVA